MQVKTILLYGSNGGAEMASTYYSIISMVLMKGKSVWKFLGDFFSDMVKSGNTLLAYLQLAPQSITIKEKQINLDILLNSDTSLVPGFGPHSKN